MPTDNVLLFTRKFAENLASLKGLQHDLMITRKWQAFFGPHCLRDTRVWITLVIYRRKYFAAADICSHCYVRDTEQHKVIVKVKCFGNVPLQCTRYKLNGGWQLLFSPVETLHAHAKNNVVSLFSVVFNSVIDKLLLCSATYYVYAHTRSHSQGPTARQSGTCQVGRLVRRPGGPPRRILK